MPQFGVSIDSPALVENFYSEHWFAVQRLMRLRNVLSFDVAAQAAYFTHGRCPS
jgi:hypothetical protein